VIATNAVSNYSSLKKIKSTRKHRKITGYQCEWVNSRLCEHLLGKSLSFRCVFSLSMFLLCVR